MEAFGVLKFWWNSATGADVASYGGDLRRPASGTDDDDETDAAEDSFFDLVFTSPNSVTGDVTNKDFQFIESPRDVFVNKNHFSDSNRIYPVTLLRSTPKFKIFMLGSRKSPKTESNGEIIINHFSKSSSKIEETNRLHQMPAACSLGRGNSSRSQLLKETSDSETCSEKSSKGSVPKYLRLIKPLYLKVWKKNEKTKYTGSVTPSPAELSPRKFSDSSRMGNFKIASKRLRKSRSASAAVGVAPPTVHRRDDSLLERHDGIQSAVLYCKKSYNSSTQFSQLFQTSHGGRTCCDEEPKRCSI
ncbi:hypothetical protein ACS0TY_010490 [Phlomoides rotata]